MVKALKIIQKGISQVEEDIDEVEKIKIAKIPALQYKNLAVKRYEAVFRIYGYKNDQHDFNSYSLREELFSH